MTPAFWHRLADCPTITTVAQEHKASHLNSIPTTTSSGLKVGPHSPGEIFEFTIRFAPASTAATCRSSLSIVFVFAAGRKISNKDSQ